MVKFNRKTPCEGCDLIGSLLCVQSPCMEVVTKKGENAVMKLKDKYKRSELSG